MSEEISRHDDAGDKAVALLRQLDELKTDEPRVAMIGERLVARAIDFAFWFVVLYGLFDLAMFAWMAYHGELTSTSQLQPKHADPTAATAQGLVLIIGAFLYCTIPIALRGQTIGKRLMGLVVVGEDYSPAGWQRAFLRFIAWEGPGIVLLSAALPTSGGLSTALAVAGIAWSLVVLAPSLFDEERRGWYDRVAGTRVVRPR